MGRFQWMSIFPGMGENHQSIYRHCPLAAGSVYSVLQAAGVGRQHQGPTWSWSLAGVARAVMIQVRPVANYQPRSATKLT